MESKSIISFINIIITLVGLAIGTILVIAYEEIIIGIIAIFIILILGFIIEYKNVG